MTTIDHHHPISRCGLRFDTTYTQLPEIFYSLTRPMQVPTGHMVIANEALATSLGLDFTCLSQQECWQLFSGQQLPKGFMTIAQAYAGHQFGHFAVLGDGRAHLLGEHVTHQADRFDIQLKGSGPTPYARRGDGKADLTSMLREYIISEAMYYLGIATTRALAVVQTDFRSSAAGLNPGGILTRVAHSHIRFGTFEYAAYQGGKSACKALLDYTIKRHYPQIIKASNPALAILEHVMNAYVLLMVKWIQVGFVHGVMNTDNMSICAQTMDYGPCAFMDIYHPQTTLSAIDQNCRYAFGNQPYIAKENLIRLAQALLPLIDDNQSRAIGLAEDIVKQFLPRYQEQWLIMMCAKLGWFDPRPSDKRYIDALLSAMAKQEADYTLTFHHLGLSIDQTMPVEGLDIDRSWYAYWQHRLRSQHQSITSARALMQKTNPVIIARNHQVEYALKSADQGDLDPLHTLLHALKSPYENIDDFAAYQKPPTAKEYVYQTFCGT